MLALMSVSTLAAGFAGALAIGVVGAIAGLGMRIPADSGVSSAAHATDARAAERNLARAETRPRLERPSAAPRVERPAPVPHATPVEPPRAPVVSQTLGHPSPYRSHGPLHFGPVHDRGPKGQHRVSRPSKGDRAHV